jgi:hypothetical protein
MDPVLLSPTDDTEFDLDVRLQALGRHASAEPAQGAAAAGTVTCSCQTCWDCPPGEPRPKP